MEHRTFLPAAGKDLFLPLYDPLTRLMGLDRIQKSLIDQAALASAHRALDIGCGTGSLTLLIKRTFPAIEVIGLDPDPKALARAMKKASRESLAIHFDRGFADSLPYPDASFDRVLSSMMFHHLKSEDRPKMLGEARRVLRPGGRFHLMDFSGEAHGFLAHIFHSHSALRDNAGDRVLRLMTEAGFSGAQRTATEHTLFGEIACYKADY